MKDGHRYDLVLRNGTVVDGTGAGSRVADVAVSAGRVAGVDGDVDGPGRREVDVSGSIVCPGFVDIHSHADVTLMVDGRGHSSLLQGITSVVTGNCGHGVAPVTTRSRGLVPSIGLGWRTSWGDPVFTWSSFGGYLEALASRGVGPNVFPLVAHGAVRLAVAGFEVRELTGGELRDAVALVRDAMSSGALGLSSGLEYAPGIAATESELAEIAGPVGDAGRLYATHCRNRTDRIGEAAREAVSVAERSGCRLQLSHFVRRPTATPRAEFERAIDQVRALRARGVPAFFDVFPFDHGPTPISTFVLPMWAREGGGEAVADRLSDRSVRARLLGEVDERFQAVLDSGIGSAMYVASDGAGGDLDGLSLREIAERWRLTVPEACIEILRRAGKDFYDATVSERWVTDDDLRFALAQDDYLIMGDGITASLDGPLAGHGFSLADWGYAPELLGRYVRAERLLNLEQAIHRMTELPATQAGLEGRGTLAGGSHADIVVFDPTSIAAGVTPDDLTRPPTGVEYVFVNGVCAVDAGRPTDALAGVVGLGGQRR